jgi:adenylate kinase family enzyme
MELSDFKYSVDYSKLSPRPKLDQEYDIISPQGRRLYFNAVVGEEITALREFLKQNTFIGYLLAPKMAGKGTYTNMLKEVIGEGYFENISVGDLVRNAEKEYLETGEGDSPLYVYTTENYRGLMGLDDIFASLTNRSTAGLSVPTDFVLMLIKREIDKIGHKSIFIDGFPRSVDQVSYSLYMRDLVNYRDDPDCFILINLPVSVINARIKERRTCPVCRNSRNLELSLTSIIGYDEEKDEIYLGCDNPSCKEKGIRMERKEGDEKGIALIKDRIITDLQVMEMARKMYGIEKIELYNSVEASVADKYTYEFDRTAAYYHEYKDGKVVSTKKDFEVEDHGVKYVSMMPPWVVVQFIRELSRMFGLTK